MKIVRVPASLSVLFLSLTLQAQDLEVLKLTGRWSNPPVGYFLGNTNRAKGLVISDQWILAGSDDASEQATRQGAVQVFNATTGAWVRKLLPPPPALAEERFGDVIAISGNLAVISTRPQVAPSRVYVYDLKSGKKLRELVPPIATDFYGNDIETSGDIALVAAQDTDNYRGAVHLFSLKTGTRLATLQPPDTVAFDYFGGDIAVDGTLAAIGAPGGNDDKGCVYLYDIPSGTLIKKITHATAVPNDDFGSNLALTGGKLVFALNAAAAVAGRGKLHSLDLITGVERIFQASDAQDEDSLGDNLSAHAGLAVANGDHGNYYVFDLHGTSNTEMTRVSRFGFFARREIAIHNGTVICTDESDDTGANGSGAVYLHRPFTRPLPMTKVVARGDFAPGVADGNFGVTGDAFINPDGEVAFTSKLTGVGSNNGKDSGLWSSQRADLGGWPADFLNLVAKTRGDVLGSPIVSVGQPLFNRPFLSLYLVKRAGSNNQIILKNNGQATERLYQNALGTAELSYTGLVQSHHFDRAAYGVTLKKGINSVFASNDTAIVFAQPSLTNQLNPVLESMREGNAAGATGLTYGQIPGRSALYAEHIVYPAALTGNPTFNSALFRKRYGDPEIVIAKKGNEAPYVSDLYSTFIGESTDDLGNTLWRATLTGPASTNEALWTRNNAGTLDLPMRKGDAVPALNGALISRFLSFWVSNGNTLALVKLSGPNVTAANDQALLQYVPTGASNSRISVLMREGEPAPGCHPATIGTISRVEVESFYGQYLVLATLTGAPANANQCLFRGTSLKDAPTLAERFLRRPIAILRKGDLYTGRPSKIQSISLPTSNLSPAGAGGTGLSTAMLRTNGGVIPNTIVLTLQFENAVRQIMKGIP